MKSHIHKTDIIIIMLLSLTAVVWLIFNTISSQKGDTVIIYCDKEIIATYDITKNKEYNITTQYGTNSVKVHNGKVSVTKASCDNQVCVHHTPIDTSDKSIICLPNHLVIKINNGKVSEVDDVAK